MSRMAEQQLYIDGGYVSATSGKTFETINPASGEVLATVQPLLPRRRRPGGKERPKRAKNLGGDERHGTFAHSA